MSDGPYRYRLYDLELHSAEALSLVSIETPDKADHAWRYEVGDVARLDEGSCIHDILDFDGQRRLQVWLADDGYLLFTYGETRVRWDRDRRLIRFEPGADLSTRPGIVLERVVAPIALMVERSSHVALHASAVSNAQGQAYIFIGESGAGKSTTALELMRRGLHLVADDLVLIDVETGQLMAAMPSVRLFDRPREVPEAVEQELAVPEISKYWYRLPARDKPLLSARIEAIFSLCPQPLCETPSVERLRGRAATVDVLAQGFDLTEADAGWRSQRFRALCQLIRNAPVYRVSYERTNRESPAQVDAIVDHLKGLE